MWSFSSISGDRGKSGGCASTRVCTAICVVLAISACSCGRSAPQYIARGNQLFGAGKYDDASINYRNALKKDPKSGEASYRLALVLLRQNKAGEAYQALIRAVELSPENLPAKVELANLSLAAYAQDPKHPASLYNRASSLVDQMLKSNPNSVDGLRLKGAIAVLDNHPGDAVQAFRHALESSHGAPDIQTALAESLLKDNQPAEGERAAQDAIASHPEYGPAYDLLYSQYVAAQRWSDAESLLKRRIANNPKDSTAILRLAAFHVSRQQPEEAEKLLNSLLDRRDTFAQADLLVGDFHTLERSYDKALADYQRGLSRDKPREKVYQERAAAVLATLGRREEALKTIDALLQKEPKDLIARALKVSVLISMGGAQNLDVAGALSTDLAKEAPVNPRIQMLTGQAALSKGDLEAATARFQQAVKIDPRSSAPRLALARVYLLRKNYAAVLQQADAILATQNHDENARLFRIIALTGNQAFAQAKDEAEQLARETSHPRQVQMQLGIIALSQKHYPEAEAYFKKLYNEGDAGVQPLAALVSTYVAENNPDRALQLLEAEKKRSPGALSTEALTAATAEAAGKYGVALTELQNMAAQAPKSADVQIRIGELQRKQGNLQAALDAFQRARDLDPNRKGVNAAIGSVQDGLGRKADAVASYKKALALMPDDPAIMNNLAYLMAETGGDLKEASRLATAGLRKAPTNPSLQDTLAWIDIQQGNTTEALPILSSITQKSPDDATFRYHYAVALFRSGNRTQARQQLETALSKQPTPGIETEIRMLLSQAQ